MLNKKLKSLLLMAVTLLLSSTFLLTAASAQVSYISNTQTLNKDGSEFYFDIDFFQPTKHVDVDGEVVALAESEDYQQLNVNLNYTYGFTNRLQASLLSRFRYNASTETVGTDTTTLVNSGAESVGVSFKYAWPKPEGMQYALVASYRESLYQNDTYTTGSLREEIVLGEGGTDVSLGLNMAYYTKSKNFLEASFLFRNPGTDISSEVVTDLNYAMVWGGGALSLGLEYVYSLEQDAYTDDPENKPQVSNGSTYLYNGVNRSWMAPHVGFNFAVGTMWRVELKAKTFSTGVSTDLGNMYSIAFVRRKSDSKSFLQKDAAFKEYKVEGTVSKVTKNRSAVVVDKGVGAGLNKGMKVDFYHFDFVGGNELIASGFVVKSGMSKSIIKITKRYSKKRVEVGAVARAGLIRINK